MQIITIQNCPSFTPSWQQKYSCVQFTCYLIFVVFSEHKNLNKKFFQIAIDTSLCYNLHFSLLYNTYVYIHTYNHPTPQLLNLMILLDGIQGEKISTYCELCEMKFKQTLLVWMLLTLFPDNGTCTCIYSLEENGRDLEVIVNIYCLKNPIVISAFSAFNFNLESRRNCLGKLFPANTSHYNGHAFTSIEIETCKIKAYLQLIWNSYS